MPFTSVKRKGAAALEKRLAKSNPRGRFSIPKLPITQTEMLPFNSPDLKKSTQKNMIGVDFLEKGRPG